MSQAEVLRVEGGRSLTGEITVSGSKNASLAILCAVALTDEVVVLDNVPNISDVDHKLRLLSRFGVKVDKREGSVILDASRLDLYAPQSNDVNKIRTSFYLVGPMVARLGEVRFPTPGGCNIGLRPVDLHLMGLRRMGVEIDHHNDEYIARVDHLRGADIVLDFASAGATQHLMTTAVLAEGETVITNAACEPEIVSLAAFLKSMGANIKGEGTSRIVVQGVKKLNPTNFEIPHDRLQAGTYLLAGAISKGRVKVTGIVPDYQMALIEKLRDTGAEVEEGADWLEVSLKRRPHSVDVTTTPYPGFPTDMQQPLSAYLAIANGTSVIKETIYESRGGHVPELNRMGAMIKHGAAASASSFIIQGVESLSGASVKASDLRAGAALILAGLAADGTTEISGLEFIDRGYERLEERLNSLGAKVERIQPFTPEKV